MDSGIAIDQHLSLGGEFDEPLAAGATGHAAGNAEVGFGIDAGDGERTELAVATGDGSGEGIAFGTQAETETGVLDVASEDHLIVGEDRRTDTEAGVGGVGRQGGFASTGAKQVAFGLGEGWEGAIRHGRAI